MNTTKIPGQKAKMKATMKTQKKKSLKSKPVQTWYQHLTTSDVNTEEVYTEETGALIAMIIRHQ